MFIVFASGTVSSSFLAVVLGKIFLTLGRYLALHFHLAELIQKISTPEVTLRKTNILLAQDHYERFLKLLDSYDILGASDCKLLEAYNDNKANFSTANTRDAAARRDVKIARFREQKELERKLEVGFCCS